MVRETTIKKEFEFDFIPEVEFDIYDCIEFIRKVVNNKNEEELSMIQEQLEDLGANEASESNLYDESINKLIEDLKGGNSYLELEAKLKSILLPWR